MDDGACDWPCFNGSHCGEYLVSMHRTTRHKHVRRLEIHSQDAGHVAVRNSDNARNPFSRRREDPLGGPLACKGQLWKHG